MGNSSSKEDPILLSQIDGHTQVPDTLADMMQHASDNLLVFGKCIGDVAEKVDQQLCKYMRKDEQEEFMQLEADKEGVVDAIEYFVRAQVMRYEQMLVEIRPGVTMKHLLRNADWQKQAAKIEELIGTLRNLRTRYTTFHAKLKANMKQDGREKKAWCKGATGWFAALYGVGVAIATTVVVICHLVPGVNVVLSAAELALVIGTGAACTATAATVAVMCFRKDEMQRAVEYLDRIERNLQEMKKGMIELRACEDRITDDMSVEMTKKLINVVITRGRRVIELCDKVK